MIITASQLGLWAVTIIAASFAGWSAGWAIGFLRGVRWEKSHHQAWLGRERRKAEKPVAVERRAARHSSPAPLSQSDTGEMAAPAPLPGTAKAPAPEEQGPTTA